MRATAGSVKLARRCNSSHRICQMRPHRKPNTSAAKIAQTITNVAVIEHILGLGRHLGAQEVTESFSSAAPVKRVPI
jgi:hypothetical protein